MYADKNNSILTSINIDNAQKKLTFISERIIKLAVIPNDISIKSHNFQLANYQRNLFSKFSIPLPDSIDNAVPKRQAEFLAGRYSAIAALDALGTNCRTIPIGMGNPPINNLG